MVKGIIFDLDGVLVSTDELHYQAWKKLATDLGIMGFTKEDNARQKGVSRMESLEIVLEKGNKRYSDEEKLAFADQKNNFYIELLQGLTDDAVLAGVKETLTLLREKGLLIGIGSVSKNTPLILEKTGLKPYIDQISCGLDISKSKPDPEVFLVAAKKLGLPPVQCLVIEDSKAGIIAAKAANMRSLGVGPEYEQLGADYKYKNLQCEIDWDSILNS